MIVIPMAGLSSRFKAAGYEKPKYMLEAGGRSLFWLSVESFRRYFGEQDFLFIMRDEAGTSDFVRSQCAELGLVGAEFVMLDHPTRGQADTVRIGVEKADVPADEPLTIFNIDSFRPGFTIPEWVNDCDGYLEVFNEEGDHWSFVEPDRHSPELVCRTTEKERISDLCSDGLYHFSRCSDFLDAVYAQSASADEELQAGEMYIAPLYNRLIRSGLIIRYDLIPRNEVFFCGIPEEYEFFKTNSLAEYEKQLRGGRL